MEYKKLGKTPYELSRIGLGCRGLIGRDLERMKAAFDVIEELGVNYIDLFSPNPEFRLFMGRAVMNRREKFIIQAHLGAVWKDNEYSYTHVLTDVERGFSDQLKSLATGHFEIGMIHHIDSPRDLDMVLNGDIMKFALKLKQMGTIGCIGLSIPDPETALLAAKSGDIETIMLTSNVYRDHLSAEGELIEEINPIRQELYSYCQEQGIGLTAMGVFGGGFLLDAEKTPLPAPLTVDQCLSYNLSQPAFASAVCTALTKEELSEACDILKLSESQQQDILMSIRDIIK